MKTYTFKGITEDEILELAEKISARRELEAIEEEKQLCLQFMKELDELSNGTLKYKYKGEWEIHEEIYDHLMYININLRDVKGGRELYSNYFHNGRDREDLPSCFFMYNRDDYGNNIDWRKV